MTSTNDQWKGRAKDRHLSPGAASSAPCVATGGDPHVVGARGERQKKLEAAGTEGIHSSSLMKVTLTGSSWKHDSLSSSGLILAVARRHQEEAHEHFYQVEGYDLFIAIFENCST